MNESEYLEYRGDKTKPKPLLDSVSLDFEVSDIKYIIVKNDKEIPKIIEFISKSKGLGASVFEANLLSTRILTVDQLNQDF